MNNQQLKNLLIVVAGLFLVAAIFTIINASQNKSSSDKYLLTADDEKGIDNFQIDNGDLSLVFQKGDTTWKVGSNAQVGQGFDADNDKVNTLLDNLTKSLVVNTASTNPTNYSLFSADDQTGISLGLFKGANKFSTIIIGKSTSRGNYVRIEGDPNVYEINQILHDTVSGTLNDFRDKTLANGTLDQFKQLTAKDYQLTKTGSDITFVNSSDKVDQSKAQVFIGSFSTLKAGSFATDDQAAKATGTPTLTYKIAFNNGSEYSFAIYDIDDNNILVKRDKDSAILVISKSQFDSLNKGVSDLKQS